MTDTSSELVTIFGGSGFVGTQIVQLLAHRGYRIRVAVRRPDLAGHVKPLGDVGQVVPIQANVRSPDSVARAVHGANIVINLVGIGAERGKQRFDAIHAEGPRSIASAAAATRASALVHMSVLGADPGSESVVSSSRAQGEAAVLAEFPGAVIMRPSLIFGPGDGFFNLMATLARLSPVLPLIGGKTLFQPVYVKDVAEAFVIAATGGATPGAVYELGGPEVVTHRQLLERILKDTGRHNLLLPIPPGLGKLMAIPMGLLPTPLLTADQVTQLQVDNIVSADAIAQLRTLPGLGIVPTPMEAVLPGYLWRFRRNGQFDRQTA
jgi:uncharacterized protein YbjT (DUF2867 family)